jgi:hypothetical protein
MREMHSDMRKREVMAWSEAARNCSATITTTT